MTQKVKMSWFAFPLFEKEKAKIITQKVMMIWVMDCLAIEGKWKKSRSKRSRWDDLLSAV